MKRRLFSLALVTWLGACTVVDNLTNGAEFAAFGQTLQLNGVITSSTPAAFEAILNENPQIKTLLFQRVDGSLDDEAVIRMGYLIRERGLHTDLQSDSAIYSGAVDLFIAGRDRTMTHGAEIGVHSWADGFGEGADYPRNAPEHRLNRRYFRDMLGSEDFYWFTLQAAASDEIYIMSAQEILNFGLLTTPIHKF